MAPSRPSSSTSQRAFSALPQMPTTRQPWILAICAASDPVAPAAADTTTVCPASTAPMSIMPTYAVRPVAPYTDSMAGASTSAPRWVASGSSRTTP